MTGGNIFSAVEQNEEYKKMFENDKMFNTTIKSLMQSADEGDDNFCETVTNMVYSFQIIYASLISTIAECGDQTTIESVNKLLLSLMGSEDTK